MSENQELNKEPLVSVVIPTYYRNDRLSKCLDSVRSQKYKNIEVIVIDDSGVSHASKITEEYTAVQYIALEENKGPNAARKVGLRQCSGEYIQLLDDDDYLEPEKIPKQVSVLEQDQDVGVAYCAYRNERGNTSRQIERPNGNVLNLALRMNLTCITSTMLLKSDIAMLILDLPEFPGSDDTFWKIEFAQRTQFTYIDEVLVHKGIPEEHREDTIGAIEGTWLVLKRYEHLYETHTESVYYTALSKAMRREAKYLLRNKLWSYRAIVLSTSALYYDPEPARMTRVLPIFSLFGMGGYKLLTFIATAK